MREVADQVLPKFGRQIDIPLPIDRAHPSCPESGSLCSTKVLTMERLEGVPIRQYAIPLMKMFAEAHGTSWDELKRILESKDMTKVDLENPAVRRVLRMGEVTEWQSRLLALGIQLRNCTGRMVGGCAEGICKAWDKPTVNHRKPQESMVNDEPEAFHQIVTSVKMGQRIHKMTRTRWWFRIFF
eukprot:symbB.v1.2.023626.t2/scaffold2176.1/size86939/5